MGVIIFVLLAVSIPVGIALLVFFLRYAGAKDDKKYKMLLSAVTTELVITTVMFIVCSVWVFVTIWNARGESTEDRMNNVDWEVEHNEFTELASSLMHYECYEEPFEYMWERCVMDQYTFLYRIYSGAVENGFEEYTDKAEEYKQKILSICENVTHSENEPYVNYFLKYVREEE